MTEGYIIYVLLAYIIYRDIIYDSRINRLLNRIMARSYEEYEYYSKKYDKDLKEVAKLRDEARDERIEDITNAEETVDKDEQKAIEAFDEDWSVNEIDKTKIESIMK